MFWRSFKRFANEYRKGTTIFSYISFSVCVASAKTQPLRYTTIKIKLKSSRARFANWRTHTIYGAHDVFLIDVKNCRTCCYAIVLKFRSKLYTLALFWLYIAYVSAADRHLWVEALRVVGIDRPLGRQQIQKPGLPRKFAILLICAIWSASCTTSYLVVVFIPSS